MWDITVEPIIGIGVGMEYFKDEDTQDDIYILELFLVRFLFIKYNV